MKWNHWIIAVVLLLLTGLGGMARFNTTIGNQWAQIAEREQEIVILEAELEATRSPPYHKPLEEARISSGCGYRMDPMGGGTENLHKGVDLVGDRGSPIVAVLAGVVVEHWPSPDSYWRGHPIYGGLVVIDHGDGLFTLYGHPRA